MGEHEVVHFQVQVGTIGVQTTGTTTGSRLMAVSKIRLAGFLPLATYQLLTR